MENTEAENTPTKEDVKGFEHILEKAKSFIKASGEFFTDFYEAYFGGVNDEPASNEADVNNEVMHKDSRRRMGRSVCAITNKPVSSTLGKPTRQKKKVVVAKTYKPELDRF